MKPAKVTVFNCNWIENGWSFEIEVAGLLIMPKTKGYKSERAVRRAAMRAASNLGLTVGKVRVRK